MSEPESTPKCPVCAATDSIREQYATAKVADHIKSKAKRDETHREWVEEHTTNGTYAEIRDAVAQDGSPRP